MKKIIKVLIWPILFMIGTLLVNYIFVAIFNSKEQGNLSNSEFIEYIKTIEYQEKLNNYINSKMLLIILLLAIIFVPIFYKLYKKYKKDNMFKLKDILIPIILGITISLTYNIIVFYLNNILHFTNKYEISNIPIIIEIISTGIIGPILEELLFRGIVYNRLKEFNKPTKAAIITSLIFGLFHLDIINGIYAFLVSFVLIYLYEKYKTLKAPIIMHIFLNTTIIFMIRLIILNILPLNLFLLIISIIILIVIKKYV